MRKQAFAFALAVAVAINLCSCAMSGAGDSGQTVKSSVTGNTESGSETKGVSDKLYDSAEPLTDPYVTKNGIYVVDDMGEYLICADRQDGQKKKIHPPNGEYDDNKENMWVSEEHICYVKEKDLFISPIRLTKESEEIAWEEKEKVAHDVEVVCLLEPYLIYIGDTVYRYDLRSKESKPLGKKGDYDVAFFFENFWLQPVVQEGKLYFTKYLENEGYTVYSLDIEKWEARKLSINMDDLTNYIFAGIQGTKMSLVREDGAEKAEGAEEFMNCFDMETGEKDTLFCGEIFDLLEKEKIWSKDKGSHHSWQLKDAFQYDGRIYLIVDMQWCQKREVDLEPDSGKATEVWMERPVLLSLPWGHINEVTYEREISEWWYNRVDSHIGLDDGDDYAEFLDGEIHSLYRGELYMEYQDGRGHHMAAYSLDNGKFREVSEKETAYYLFDEYALFR